MPITKSYGVENEVNEALGGVPVIHYFDYLSRGRGQVLRLFLIDANAAFTDTRYSFTEWAQDRLTIATLNPLGSVPVVEMPDGRVLTGSYAILRHWARVLGRYDGGSEEKRVWVDGVCDAVGDWRTLFVSAAFSPNPETTLPLHKYTDLPRFLSAISTKLSSSPLSQRGSFVIGTEITYADFVLYQILHDEDLTQNGRKGLKEYPRLRDLVDAVEGRENVRRWLRSECYLG